MTGRRTIAGALGIGAAVILAAAGAVLLRPGPQPGTPTVARDNSAPPAQGAAASAEAGALMTAAEQVLNRGDDAAAAELYGRALALYRRQDDLSGQGSAYLGLGRMEHFTGQSDPAREHFDQAFALFRQAGNAANEARALAARADLEKDTFNWAAAARFYRDARAAWLSTTKVVVFPQGTWQLRCDPRAIVNGVTFAMPPPALTAA